MVVAFHRQEPAYQDNFKVLVDLFMRHAKSWREYVDCIYVIESGFTLTTSERANAVQGLMSPMGSGGVMRFTPGTTSFISRPPDSHWGNFNAVIREHVKEDIVGLIDSDMLVCDANKAIRMPFTAIEDGLYAAVGILDNSGNADLSAYPLMAANENREARKRLAPYLCFFRRDVLRSDFDFTAQSEPVAYDSMGKITHAMLADGVKIGEMRDDRSSIYLEDDNRIISTQWLDTPPKKWATEENPDLGYYHIRNFSGGLNLANSYWVDSKVHEHLVAITPRREALRLLSWLWIACEKTGRDVDFIWPAIVNVITKGQPLALPREEWPKYINAIKSYYPWMESL